MPHVRRKNIFECSKVAGKLCSEKFFLLEMRPSQLAFTCSKSTMGTTEQCMKLFSKLTINTPEQRR